MMILLALAAQLGSPGPLTPLLTPDDVPLSLMKENVFYRVRVALTVKPDGRVQGCAAEASSGNKKLDAYTCKLLAGRAKFAPPKSENGAPVYQVYRLPIDWWMGDGNPKRPAVADLFLDVSALPKGLTSPVEVRLKFAVDAAGRMSNCAAESAGTNAELVRIGCDQLFDAFKAPPAKNADGVPVASVQNAAVLFRTK